MPRGRQKKVPLYVLPHGIEVVELLDALVALYAVARVHDKDYAAVTNAAVVIAKATGAAIPNESDRQEVAPVSFRSKNALGWSEWESVNRVAMLGFAKEHGMPIEYAYPAGQTSDARDEEITALRRCLGFFASVIKSGEPWTATCQSEYDAAMQEAGK